MAPEKRQLQFLLVEDDDEDALIFRHYVEQLEPWDVNVSRVESEDEALRYMSGNQPDIIFIDWHLKRPDGGDYLLRECERRGIDIPRIVVTGTGDEQTAAYAMKTGAYDYLVKDNLGVGPLERAIRNVRQKYAVEQERKQLIKRLAELSTTDDLTRLANRRRFEEKLDEELRRFHRTGHVFSLLMIDLDNFKAVNDEYGHQKGDEVLRKSARLLEKAIRDTDFVARYGGEEFCVLLPNTGMKGAKRLADRVRSAMEALPPPFPTMSIGVACAEQGMTAERLVKQADRMLYTAKEAGRNRVEGPGHEVEVKS